MADGMACGPEPVPTWERHDNHAVAIDPGAVATRLDGRPRRTVPGQFSIDPRISHG